MPWEQKFSRQAYTRQKFSVQKNGIQAYTRQAILWRQAIPWGQKFSRQKFNRQKLSRRRQKILRGQNRRKEEEFAELERFGGKWRLDKIRRKLVSMMF